MNIHNIEYKLIKCHGCWELAMFGRDTVIFEDENHNPDYDNIHCQCGAHLGFRKDLPASWTDIQAIIKGGTNGSMELV